VDEVAFEEDGTELFYCHCLGFAILAKSVNQQVEFVLLEVRGFPHGEDDLEDRDGQFAMLFELLVELQYGNERFAKIIFAFYDLLDYQQNDIIDVNLQVAVLFT
jgi:hypothetical protein